MPVPDFVDRVTDRIKEILVCRQDGAIHAKLDDRLRLANSRHLAVAISGQQLLLGHVGREFHNLERLAGIIENRIIGRENPDFLATLADALVFGRLILTPAEPRPEVPVGCAIAFTGFHEHAVMPPLYFGQRVTKRVQEILVCGNDSSVKIEFDDRLRTADRDHFSGGFEAFEFLRRDICSEFDDFERLTTLVHDRVIGGLDPDLPAAFGDPLELPCLKFTPVKVTPELPISDTLVYGRLHKYTVVLALDLIERVAERLEKILIRFDDRAIEIEFYDGLGATDGGRLRQRILQIGLALSVKHLSLRGQNGRCRKIVDERRRAALRVVSSNQINWKVRAADLVDQLLIL